MSDYTIGLDVSTQAAKAVACDAEGRILARSCKPYPEPFRPVDDPAVREADPLSWIEASEAALADLAAAGYPSSGRPVGGSAQQHGTVYSDADGNLTRRYAPIWMDVSAAREAAELDARFGDEMLRRTGSRSQSRFAAAQILKFARMDPAAFDRTARIDLVSSYIARHFSSERRIDFSDAAGMNLLNLETGDWDEEICAYIHPDLVSKLPPVTRTSAFTGDNPATLVGCGAERPGTAIVSLGTSDVFMSAVEPDVRPPGGLGHVFGNPTGKLMALVCVKNGSLARDCVRRELGVDWKFFDETAWMNEGRDARRGESRKTAFPFFEEEITPPHPATGVEANFDWQNASSDEKVRAIVRGQVANLREHTRWTGDFSRIMVVGGASRSEGICRTIAEVFGADVVPADDADAAARGAALLAWRRFSS